MKRLLFLVVLLICISGSEAFADYSFNFISNDGTYGVQGTLITPSNGNGPLIVSGGSVIGDGTANNNASYSLVPAVPGGSIRPFAGLPGDGTDLIFDNQLTPGSNPVLDGNGLVFYSANINSYLNIWGNGPSSYTLFQLGYNTTALSEIYGPQVNGTVTATATPIPAAAYLLGSGLMGLVGIRRKMNN